MESRFLELQQHALAHAFITANQRVTDLPLVHLADGWSVALSVNR